jgi:hypothetical protein
VPRAGAGLRVELPDEPEVVDLERQGVGYHRVDGIDEPEGLAIVHHFPYR